MPLVGGAGGGQLKYADVDLNAGATRVSVNLDPEKDEAGRTTVRHRYAIEVDTVIQADDDTDDAMLNLRRKLTRSGQVLVFDDKGFNNLSIGTAGGMIDLCAGPHPEILSWRP